MLPNVFDFNVTLVDWDGEESTDGPFHAVVEGDEVTVSWDHSDQDHIDYLAALFPKGQVMYPRDRVESLVLNGDWVILEGTVNASK